MWICVYQLLKVVINANWSSFIWFNNTELSAIVKNGYVVIPNNHGWSTDNTAKSSIQPQALRLVGYTVSHVTLNGAIALTRHDHYCVMTHDFFSFLFIYLTSCITTAVTWLTPFLRLLFLFTYDSCWLITNTLLWLSIGTYCSLTHHDSITVLWLRMSCPQIL